MTLEFHSGGFAGGLEWWFRGGVGAETVEKTGSVARRVYSEWWLGQLGDSWGMQLQPPSNPANTHPSNPQTTPKQSPNQSPYCLLTVPQLPPICPPTVPQLTPPARFPHHALKRTRLVVPSTCRPQVSGTWTETAPRRLGGGMGQRRRRRRLQEGGGGRMERPPTPPHPPIPLSPISPPP